MTNKEFLEKFNKVIEFLKVEQSDKVCDESIQFIEGWIFAMHGFSEFVRNTALKDYFGMEANNDK